MTSLDQTSFGASSADPSSTAASRGQQAEVEAETAANLLAGLANRLRSAYEGGADPVELATACRQPLSIVHRLLEEAGADLSTAQPTPATPAAESRHLRRLRRPSPSRRLRRIHNAPRVVEAITPDGPPAEATSVPDTHPEYTSEAGAPLGILIGGTPGRAEAAPQSRTEAARRVAARLLRVGRGTSLVVLPDWRSAIAVSVPTEQLLASTGFRFEELATARLSVLINPDALHDRELGLDEWRAEPPPR